MRPGGLPGLGIGTTKANFHSLGTKPVSSIRLKRFKSVLRLIDKLANISNVILSSPHDFFLFESAITSSALVKGKLIWSGSLFPIFSVISLINCSSIGLLVRGKALLELSQNCLKNKSSLVWLSAMI